MPTRVHGTPVLAAALCLALLAGCATTAPQAQTPAPPPPMEEPQMAAPAEPELTQAEEAGPTTPPKDRLRDLLDYADRMQRASTVDLAREMARLSDGDENKPGRNLRLALVLLQTRQPADTARALGLVQRALAHADAQDLHPLARLLEARLTHQRKLEDQLERQAQQLRDAQRRNDQLSDRLEAMRAIERSLNTRPPTPVAPASNPASPNGSASSTNTGKP